MFSQTAQRKGKGKPKRDATNLIQIIHTLEFEHPGSLGEGSFNCITKSLTANQTKEETTTLIQGEGDRRRDNTNNRKWETFPADSWRRPSS